MAVKTFSEIYDSLSADEKKLLDNITAKHQDLKEGWLRQDDFSRQSNELKAKKTEYDAAVEYNERMKTWADVNVPKWDKLVASGAIDAETGEPVVTPALKVELERQLAEAKKQAVGGDMDPAELDRRVREIVKENGSVSKEELTALIASQAKALAAETFTEQWKEKETNFNEKTIPYVAGFSAGVAVVAARYEKETGKEWTSDTAKELFGVMAKEQEFDPYKAGQKFMEPSRKDKETKDAIKAGVEEELKKRGISAEGGGDGYIPQPEQKGALQLMLEKSSEGGDFETMIRSHAVEATKELRAEGKG